ncbi:choice-of-anchor L domain-containing protein [Enterococcus sp. LJL99]
MKKKFKSITTALVICTVFVTPLISPIVYAETELNDAEISETESTSDNVEPTEIESITDTEGTELDYSTNRTEIESTSDNEMNEVESTKDAIHNTAQRQSIQPFLSSSTVCSTGTVADYVNHLLSDTSISVSNITFTGSPKAASFFSNGMGTLGIDSGIILSTGDTQTANSHLGQPGDSDLSALTGANTYDAVSIEFDFVPQYSNLTFNYVFGSSEYPDYVGSVYNDSFAFFVNGSNEAIIPGTTDFVSINNVNSTSNSSYFISNTDNHLGDLPGTSFGGITTVLPINATVIPKQTNHIKIVIADTSDSILDSFVAIGSNSFKSTGKVNVSYQDEEGNSIESDLIIDGNTGDSYSVEPKEIPGYDFLYWDGTPAGTIEESTIFIKAIYKKKISYPVNFVSNGGSEVDSQTVNINGTADIPTDPIRDGYTFDGWYIDQEMTTLYDFATPVTQATTLYAKWIPKTNYYPVNFVGNGGSDTASQTVEENKTASKPEDPTRDGFTFEGWYIDQGLTTLYDFATPVTEVTTLYAKWSKRTEKPKPETNNTSNNKGSSIVKNTTVSSNKQKSLPRTGMLENNLFSLFGNIVLLLSLLLMYKKNTKYDL